MKSTAGGGKEAVMQSLLLLEGKKGRGTLAQPRWGGGDDGLQLQVKGSCWPCGHLSCKIAFRAQDCQVV